MSLDKTQVWEEDEIEVMDFVKSKQLVYEDDSEETSFSSPRGKEPLLGENWAHKPSPPRTKPRVRLRKSMISPSESPVHHESQVHSLRDSPNHSHQSPVHHIVADVHASPFGPPNSGHLKETVIEMFQASHSNSPSFKPIALPRTKDSRALPRLPPLRSLQPQIMETATSPSPKLEPLKTKAKKSKSVIAESANKSQGLKSPSGTYEVKLKSPKSRVELREHQSSSSSTSASPTVSPKTYQAYSAVVPKKQDRKKGKEFKRRVAVSNADVPSALDFFTRSWEVEKHSPSPHASPTSQDTALEVEENISSPEHATARFTLADYFGANHLSDLTVYQDPIPRPDEAKKENFFYPSTKPVSLEDKLGPNVEPRYKEEEGFYVGVRPDVPWKIRNKVEQRLVANPNSARKWFGEDGEIICVEDALHNIILQPNIGEDINPALQTEFRDAEVLDRLHNMGQPLLLELEIHNLQFTHHPLYSVEHLLAQQLQHLYTQHSERIAGCKVERLAGRLRALRHARDLLIERTNGQERLQKYKAEIKSTRSAMFAEGAKDRIILASILRTWKELRAVRQAQGFVCTPLRLEVHKSSRSEEEAQQERQEWDIENENMVAEILEEKSEKTEPPSESKVRQKAIKLLTESRRPPGEPYLSLELMDSEDIDSSIYNSKEKQRRLMVQRSKVQLQIRYNEQDVCRSPLLPLGQQFMTPIGLLLPLSVTQWPDQLSVQVWCDMGVLRRHLVAEVPIPLPPRCVTLSSALVERLQFSGSHSGTCIHGPCTSCPAGVLVCRVGWGTDETGKILEPPAKYWASLERSRTGPSLPKSAEELKQWVERTQLDPNDPKNASVFNQLKSASEEDPRDEKTSEFDFCSERELEEGDARLRILELRSLGEPEFCALRMIPSLVRELPPGVIKDFEARKLQSREHLGEVGEVLQPETSLSAQRAWGRARLREVREQVVQQSRLARRRRQLRDLVMEDLVPDIGTLGLTFMQWLQPSRPLRPMRKPRKQVAPLPGLNQEVFLILNVVSAFQVPVRKEMDTVGVGRTSLSSSVGSPGFNTVAVRPFVEVTFQGHSARTIAADGANPTWNQELQLPLKNMPGERGAGGSKDHVLLQLYDEVVLDLLEDDRLRSIDVHQRLQRNWLGSISFPFSALQQTSRIDGTFPLNSPPLLGYEREGQLRQFGPIASQLDSPRSPRQEDSSTATFLTLFATVQPTLQVPELLQERLESSETPELEQHLEAWESEVASLWPERKLLTLVPDAQGKSACITRFFRPIKSPVLDEERTGRLLTDQAARFISLIPKADVNNVLDVWLTADLVLQLVTSDTPPQTALLVCFLQHLGLRSYFLIGSGLISGSGGYVLTRGCGLGGLDDEFWVWDVRTGQRYTVHDPFCPVNVVWGLANQDNIWANIQREVSPRRMKFDLTRANDWSLAFPPGDASLAPVPLDDCLQPEELSYIEGSSEACQDLGERLEKVLRDNFMSWRPNMRTRWNRHCSAVLKKILPAFEMCLGKPEQMRDLQPLLAAHKMTGFPLQMPFCDEASVIRALQATSLHTNHDQDVEFGLAVHIFRYPNQVVSVWVYAASLIRRR